MINNDILNEGRLHLKRCMNAEWYFSEYTLEKLNIYNIVRNAFKPEELKQGALPRYDKRFCDCPMDVLMKDGCKCGGI